MMKKWFLVWFVFSLLIVACVPTTGTAPEGIAVEPTPLNMDDPFVQDAAAFAESIGIPLGEAVQRLSFQDTIGDIQPALQGDFPDSYGGLWVEHQPDYRIVIALTKGDETTIQPYIEGQPWVEFVEVRQVETSLAKLLADQQATNQIISQLNVNVTTAVDVKNNRVELIVGNPELLQADLETAGLTLPSTVQLLPISQDGPLPDSNKGAVYEAITGDGRTIYLPIQPPTVVSMAALLEGSLVEMDGCLRVTTEGYDNGFLILWPNDSDIRAGDDNIEVLNGQMKIIARVGEPIRLGGGAAENSRGMSGMDEMIPGMPLENCPGPYWIAAPLETLVEQAVPDIYVNPYSSNGQILLLMFNQSRPAIEEEILTGELTLDEQKCMRVDEYTILWPPDIYPREEPLRLVDGHETEIVQIGDQVRITGAEKEAGDYRFFENKVSCPGPFWGANQVSSLN